MLPQVCPRREKIRKLRFRRILRRSRPIGGLVSIVSRGFYARSLTLAGAETVIDPHKAADSTHDKEKNTARDPHAMEHFKISKRTLRSRKHSNADLCAPAQTHDG